MSKERQQFLEAAIPILAACPRLELSDDEENVAILRTDWLVDELKIRLAEYQATGEEK